MTRASDPDGMSRYLYSELDDVFARTSMSPDERAVNRAGDVLQVSQHMPAVQAAAFEALARIPGVFVRQGVTDVAGREGVALVYGGIGGGQSELVFEPDTYRYLGVNRPMVWRVAKPAGDSPGFQPLPLREAVMSVAVVDQIGQGVQ